MMLSAAYLCALFVLLFKLTNQYVVVETIIDIKLLK